MWYSDYKFKTTFDSDFTIAEKFGASAIKDTFNRAFNEWKNDYEYLTELVLILNWKLWAHYENGNMEYARLYNDLWEKAQDYGYTHLSGDELTYFIRTLD